VENATIILLCRVGELEAFGPARFLVLATQHAVGRLVDCGPPLEDLSTGMAHLHERGAARVVNSRLVELAGSVTAAASLTRFGCGG
jgi:hypothetical protein